ncbi:MAG: hypothetical protein HC812_12250 [Leptolyngbya sp. RL_3_1]|nr:hypothetical protein [Leptolyngbya sp. RL_3_1]
MLHPLRALWSKASQPKAHGIKPGSRTFGLCTAIAALFTLGAQLPAPQQVPEACGPI